MKTNLFILTMIAAVQLSFAGGYKVGDIATDFKLKNIDGKMVSLADYEEAKGFIVIFTCNHCPYSIAYEDRIIDLDKKYKTMGYPVIAISPNNPEVNPKDSYPLMQERAKEKGFTFPYLYDEGQKVYPVYGATRTPHAFLLNKEDNNLVVEYIGAIDNNHADATHADEKFLADAVDAVMSGKKPSPNFTKAIGCSIK